MDGHSTTVAPIPRLARWIALAAVTLFCLLAAAAPSQAAAYELLTSATPDRAAPAALDGGTVQGDIHVFVSPDAGASQVLFWLDRPSMSGTPTKIERSAPWDFGGSAKDGSALPFDTTTLADGAHTITATVTLSGGDSQVVQAAFTVANDAPHLAAAPAALSFTVDEGATTSPQSVGVSMTDGSSVFYSATFDAAWIGVTPPSGSTPGSLSVAVDATGLAAGTHTGTVTVTGPNLDAVAIPVTLQVRSTNEPEPGAYALLSSASPNRSGPVALEGRSVSGLQYVFLAPEAGASGVRFWLDDPTMSGTPRKVEKTAPWDFVGSAPDDSALPFDTTRVADGVHVITAAVTLAAGGTEVVHASFTVANDAPRLVASPTALTFGVQEGGSTPAKTIAVTATDGSSVQFSASDNASWLSVTVTDPDTPGQVSVEVNATGLAAGTHSGAVTLTSAGLDPVSVPVTLQVEGDEPEPGAYALVASTSPTRSAPAPLEGQTVAGAIYVFLTPESGVGRARFYLDDPQMTGTPRKIESGAPYDFAGSASDGSAIAFDTTTQDDGLHTITATVELTTGGTEVVTSSFRIANQGPALEAAPGSLSFAAAPGDAAAPRTVEVAMSDGSAVPFTVTDDASWLTVTPASGTTPRQLTVAVDSAGLSKGSRTATVTVTAPGLDPLTIPVTLQVVDSLEPDQVHLAWVEEPSTSLTVVWRTWQVATPHVVEYREAGESAWRTALGAARPSGTTGTLHEVTLDGLTPSTTYEYRVRGDGSAWSDVFSARTAPPPGPADFDAVYVADTGLIGRADGLATGTQQVIDEIDALDPDLVLLGGDYAYYNTDQRYGTLDNSIDAWFNQMQPIGSGAPMMVAYGNHETLLSERFEDWAPRFATPEGWDDRRAYSFDVGDVHFVSIFAVSDISGLSSGQLQWIEDDIVAAKLAGARWVVPFFHVSPFAEGSSHPSNLQLRAQLGPLFERLGVKLAIASHDQAYERSYPLVGVPSNMTRTSTSKRCYTTGDGVTWVKVSPGGKLSNKNGNFSQFATTTPPFWTADRDNTAHHYARLRVSASGSLKLETFGVLGDGGAPVLVDSFEYRLGACPPELRLDREQLTFDALPGDGAAEQTLSLSANGATSYAVQDDAPWLTVTPGAGTTPATLHVTADPSGLEPGRHVAHVTVSADGATPAVATVVLNVHGIVVSTAPDRSAPVPLDGATVSGRIYVFTLPHVGPTLVQFWLDDPAMSGTPRKIEKSGPWDFAGSATDGSALPFDASRLPAGEHTITAAVDLPDREIVLHARFTR
jgi:hypothetical protein